MASYVNDVGAAGLTSGGGITWASDTIKARIVKSTATIAKTDTTMTPYTTITGSTDFTLANKNKDTATSGKTKFGNTSTALSWTAVAAGETVMGIVIFKFVTNDAGSTPIAFIDTTDTPTNGGNITYTEGSDGLFYLSN